MRHHIMQKAITLLCSTILLITSSLLCRAASAPTTVPNKKTIALTFDDGPSKPYTAEVIAILKENKIKATFFVTGGSVSAHPAMLQQLFADGNVIGNHTYSHPNLATLTESSITKELNQTDALIYRTINVHPRLFRPPHGACSAVCKKTVGKMGFKLITWHYMVNDWDTGKTTAATIATQIVKNARPQAIMTMHDGGGNRAKTVAALPVIIAALKKEGYQFVTVAELLNISPYKEGQPHSTSNQH